MSDDDQVDQESAEGRAADFTEGPVLPEDVASAGRSCSVILILLAVIVLMLCVSVGFRWYTGA